MTARAAPKPLTPAQVGRRYLLLTGLRWLPVGISIPVTVLLGLSRGLTLADLGVVFLAHSLLVAVLELPTSRLADVVGRRPVLVASGVLHLLSSLAYATAEGLLGFLGAACLLAVGRGRRPGRGGPVGRVLVATRACLTDYRSQNRTMAARTMPAR